MRSNSNATRRYAGGRWRARTPSPETRPRSAGTSARATPSIAQWAPSYALYHEPANREIAEFIGRGTFLPGIVLEGNRVKLELGELQGDTPISATPGATVDVLLRPDDILHDDASPMQATVITKAFRGAQFIYTLELPGGGRVMSLVPSHHNHAIGEKIGIRLEMDHVVAFARG